jgi:hypothetical protein
MNLMLQKLRKCDPATYRTYLDGISHFGVLAGERCEGSPQKAWLQAVLQEAIAAKLWDLCAGCHPKMQDRRCYAVVSVDDTTYTTFGDTHAQALLAAYIAAKEDR